MAGLLADEITNDLGVVAATVANGQTKSEVIDLKAGRAHHLNTPAGMVAADITFEVCDTEDGTFKPLYTTSGAFAIPTAVVAANRAYLLDLEAFYGVRYLKVVLSIAAAAERLITISTVPR